jgi:hypothetical protein
MGNPAVRRNPPSLGRYPLKLITSDSLEPEPSFDLAGRIGS